MGDPGDEDETLGIVHRIDHAVIANADAEFLKGGLALFFLGEVGRMDVVEWLLDSDVAIRWQVMRDLTDAPEDDVTAERARVATEGWGARLLALQRQDGH